MMRLSVFPLSSTKESGKFNLSPFFPLARPPRPRQTCAFDPASARSSAPFLFLQGPRGEEEPHGERGWGQGEGECWGLLRSELQVPWDRPSHRDLFPTDRGALPAMPSSHDCHAPRKVSPQQNGRTQQVQGECLHRLRHRGSISVSGWWASIHHMVI